MPTNTPQKGKIILVTGASSGIGLLTARALHAQGHVVYGASRRVVEGSIPWLAMDVTDDPSVHAGVAAIIATHGRLDALIACAGFGIAGAVEDTTIAEAQAQFATNYFGVVRCVQQVLPQMRAQGSGLICVVGSIGGRIAIPFQAHYSASKFALEGFCEALRMELHPFHIDVSLVEPGDFNTGFTAARIMASNAGPHSPYAARAQAAIAQMARDEQSGSSPEMVAAVLSDLVRGRRRGLRHPVGGWLQTLAIRLKAILPASVFEKMVMDTYKL